MRLRRLGELAKVVAGELIGSGNLLIEGVAPIAEAKPTEISFAESLKVLVKYREHTQAGALIVPREAQDVGRPHIKVDNPRLAFAQVLEEFAWAPDVSPGIDPSAVVHETAKLGKGVAIGPQVVVGAEARIGKGTVLMGGVYVGSGTVLGENCLVYPNVCVRERLQIGNRVIIHAGAVVGEDGFGFVPSPEGYVKVPHIGTVIIEDDVEIGANTAIERGTCGATIIRRGTKIGNLVQVGHNSEIGEDCLVVALTGIAGSATLGQRVVLAGQSGVTGHLEVGNDCVVAARGLVAGDLPPGSYVSGFPARSHRENMRILAAERRLPELLKRVKQLEDQMASMVEDDVVVWHAPDED